MRGLLEGVEPLSALHDDLRRRIYISIRRLGRPVTREEIAKEAGISVKLAAFHLDKLVRRGLLKVHYARPPGRRGPGAGRTAKYYEPSDLLIELSIPARHYDLAGELLVRAIDRQQEGETPREAAVRVAGEAGKEIGFGIRADSGGRLGQERALAAAEKVLESQGFEPLRVGERELRLRNCPFHRLARQAPGLICTMNQAFIEGLTSGLGNADIQAAMEPSENGCCVVIRAGAKERGR